MVLQLPEDLSEGVTDEPDLNRDSLVIPPTYKTPEIVLKSNGNMLIKGRSIPEDASGFYERLLDWIVDYSEDPMEITSVSIMLEYVNDGSMKY